MKKWNPDVITQEFEISDDEYRQRIDELAESLIEYFGQLQRSESNSHDSSGPSPVLKPLSERTGTDG